MNGVYLNYKLTAKTLYILVRSFKKQFAKYLADGIGSEDVEEIYTNAYAAIREDPTFKPSEKEKDWKAESLKFKTNRLTLAQRREKIQEKIDAFKAGGGAAAEEDEDDDEDDE
jgi:large subunit ribosomal protein L5e